MTGHRPNAPQNQEFLSTMHTMIDDLDTISSAIDEHTYLRLVNGLQRLYNIHNSGTQANTSNNVAQNISSALVRHYERVNDISGIPINSDAYPVNADAYPVNSDVYPVNSDNVNSTNDYILNSNANNEINQALFRESARISYTALYNGAHDYWNQARHREFQENISAL
jgi:hypothetical protein